MSLYIWRALIAALEQVQKQNLTICYLSLPVSADKTEQTAAAQVFCPHYSSSNISQTKLEQLTYTHSYINTCFSILDFTSLQN